MNAIDSEYLYNHMIPWNVLNDTYVPFSTNESLLHKEVKQLIAQTIKGRHKICFHSYKCVVLKETPVRFGGNKIRIPDVLILYGIEHKKFLELKYGFWIEVETFKWIMKKGYNFKNKLKELCLPSYMELILVLATVDEHAFRCLKFLDLKNNITIMYKHNGRWRTETNEERTMKEEKEKLKRKIVKEINGMAYWNCGCVTWKDGDISHILACSPHCKVYTDKEEQGNLIFHGFKVTEAEENERKMV
jgi:hypothetical protein